MNICAFCGIIIQPNVNTLKECDVVIGFSLMVSKKLL